MLHWPTGLAVPLLPSLAPRATLPLQRNERGVELVLALMALEVVADFLPGHATAAPQRDQQLVGKPIADAIAEDITGAVLAVFPQRQSGLQMNHLDLVAAIEHRVEQRQPDGLRLAAPGDSAEHAGRS